MAIKMQMKFNYMTVLFKKTTEADVKANFRNIARKWVYHDQAKLRRRDNFYAKGIWHIRVSKQLLVHDKLSESLCTPNILSLRPSPQVEGKS